METVRKKKNKLALLTCIFVILAVCGIMMLYQPDETAIEKFEMQQQIEQEFEDLMTKYGIEDPKWGFELAGDDESEEYDGKPLTALDIDTAFSSDIYTPLIFTLYNYGTSDLSEEDIKNLLIDAYKLTNKWMWEYNKELDSTEERKTELKEYQAALKEEDKDIGDAFEPIYPYINVQFIRYKQEASTETGYYFLKDIILPSSTYAVHMMTCGDFKDFKIEAEHKLVLINSDEVYTDDYDLDEQFHKKSRPDYLGEESSVYNFFKGLMLDMTEYYEETDNY